jgi:hypothetical protein
MDRTALHHRHVIPDFPMTTLSLVPIPDSDPVEKTSMKYRALIILGVAVSLSLSAPGWHRRAEAATVLSVLSFDSSTYIITPGHTVQVQVLLSQTAGGNDAQVSAANALYSAGFQVFFNNPSGVASVTNITASAAFAFSSPTITATSATLTESLLVPPPPGITTLPGVLGTFTFTGLTSGTTRISVVPIANQFSTAGANILNPTSATAILIVPEPSSIVMALTGGPLLLAGLALRRSRRRVSAGAGAAA